MSITTSLTQLVTAAVQDIGALDSGGTLSAQQLADGLIVANNWLDNHSSQELDILSSVLTSVALTNGVQQYTLPGQRAMKVVSAALRLGAGPGSGIEVLDAERWSRVPDRQAQSYLTRFCFYDRQYPSASVYCSPVPLGGATAELTVWAPLVQFPDTTTVITIIPGYLRFITLGVAIDIAPQYDVAPTPTLMSNYADAMANVRGLNADLLRQIPTTPSPAAPAGQ